LGGKSRTQHMAYVFMQTKKHYGYVHMEPNYYQDVSEKFNVQKLS